MGSNNSISTRNISVEFFHENKNIYQLGEYVEGIIQFNNDNNDEFELLNLTIELIGELVYTINERKGRTTLTTTQKIPFFIKRISQNDKKKFLSKNENNKWKFNFYLSNEIPSSFPQINPQGPFIHYFIRVKSLFDQTNFIFKKDFPIIVQRPSQLINSLPLQIKNTFKEDLQLNLTIEKDSGFIGQDLKMQMDLYNPNNIKINRISLNLIQLRKLGPVKEERQSLLKQYLTKILINLKIIMIIFN